MNEVLNVPKYKSIKENKDLRNRALAMYMSKEFYPTEIASELNIDINELGEYVFGKNKLGTSKYCWKVMRDEGQIPTFVSNYVEIKTLYIKKTEKKLLDLTNVVLDEIAGDKSKIMDMTTKDLNNLVTAMEKIDKIGRLEEGKSTQNVVTERTSYSLREIVTQRRSLPDVIVKDKDE